MTLWRPLGHRDLKMAITEITRRNILAGIKASGYPLWGDLRSDEFLSRIYDMDDLPSINVEVAVRETAPLLESADEVNEFIGDLYYGILDDPRFGLLDGDDSVFLRFLCEMVHLVVYSDAIVVERLLQIYNAHLKHDGFQIVEKARISGKPIYAARNVGVLGIPNLSAAKQSLDLDSHISTQITRMETAVSSDPELAIGTAKELVETCCRTILDARNEKMPKNSKITITALVKSTCRVLALTPDDIPNDAKAAETIKRLLSNFATIVQGVAELRNAYGTGHGKPAGTKGLQSRHAKLVVGAATALAVFLVETHQVRSAQNSRE